MNLKQQNQPEIVRVDSHEQMASFGGEKSQNQPGKQAKKRDGKAKS